MHFQKKKKGVLGMALPPRGVFIVSFFYCDSVRFVFPGALWLLSIFKIKTDAYLVVITFNFFLNVEDKERNAEARVGFSADHTLK